MFDSFDLNLRNFNLNLAYFSSNLAYFNLNLAKSNMNLRYFKLDLTYFNFNLTNIHLGLTYFNLSLKSCRNEGLRCDFDSPAGAIRGRGVVPAGDVQRHLFEKVSLHVDDGRPVGLVGADRHRPRPQVFGRHLLLDTDHQSQYRPSQ